MNPRRLPAEPPALTSLFRKREKLATASSLRSLCEFVNSPFPFPSSILALPTSNTPGIRCIVTLECTEARAEGGTPSRYTTQKVGRNRK